MIDEACRLSPPATNHDLRRVFLCFPFPVFPSPSLSVSMVSILIDDDRKIMLIYPSHKIIPKSYQLFYCEDLSAILKFKVLCYKFDSQCRGMLFRNGRHQWRSVSSVYEDNQGNNHWHSIAFGSFRSNSVRTDVVRLIQDDSPAGVTYSKKVKRLN